VIPLRGMEKASLEVRGRPVQSARARSRLAEEAPGRPLEGARPDFEILYAEAARLLGRAEP
jgi:hypothetical protein